MTDSISEQADSLERFGVLVQHHFGGDVYAKETFIPMGVELAQHEHPFDHLSILAAGRVLVHCDGVSKLFSAPACIEIKAGVQHMVTALTDVRWYCVHATKEKDPAKVDAAILGAR
jgi:quercetin dioxygenase-like cupin family protein